MKKNKIYILIALLTIAIIFSVAAICNQCGLVTPATTTTTEKVGVEESTTAETTAATTANTEETTAAETTAATTTGTTASEAPTIKLEIYEGPTYKADGDICYYRVKATVTGKPAPTVSFSKDDSSGSWGSKKAQINITKSSPSYTLTAVAKNSAGEASDSITLKWDCGPLVTEKTADFHPNIIGTVGPGGYLSTAGVALGDSVFDTDWRGRFAFDVSSLAGKEIVSAKLKFANPDLTPNPCNFKGNIVINFNDFVPLDSTDYGTSAYASAGIFPWNADPLEISTDFLKTKVTERASAHVELQFGIGYENLTTGGAAGVAEGRVYYADDITLTVVYNE